MRPLTDTLTGCGQFTGPSGIEQASNLWMDRLFRSMLVFELLFVLAAQKRIRRCEPYESWEKCSRENLTQLRDRFLVACEHGTHYVADHSSMEQWK